MNIKALQICMECANPDRHCHGACPCPIDRKDIIEHSSLADCPISKHLGLCPITTAIPTSPTIRWGEFHRRALAYRGDRHSERRYLDDEVFSLLSCGDCRTHYLSWMQEHSSEVQTALAAGREEYFTVGWKLHEDVNRINGVTGLSLADARAMWG